MSMTEKEFLKDFHRLEGGFPFLARDSESHKAREAAYWMVLKELSAKDWKRAVTLINENWESETFPVPAVVKKYVEQERNRRSCTHPKPDCKDCNGTGWAGYTDSENVYRVKECECLRQTV